MILTDEDSLAEMCVSLDIDVILCDNNLSALPAEYQDHIIDRYKRAGIPLLDANSGFEPQTFTEEVYRRWSVINRGPWRFAYDELKERDEVIRVMTMLRGLHQNRKRVYVLIGNEPFADCMQRIQEALDYGCLPHAQPFIKLVALERIPDPRHDWTIPRLRQVARWVNRRLWKVCKFDKYDTAKTIDSNPLQGELPINSQDIKEEPKWPNPQD